MKSRIRTVIPFVLCLIAGPVLGHDFTVGSLKIDHPWTRATPKGAAVAGGYLKITNNGSTPDKLIGGSFANAGRFEIHEMKMENGVMLMRAIPGGLEIKPGQTVELKPGGYHVMFMDLKVPVEQGKRVKGTLVFEKAGNVDVEYAVEAIGGSGSSSHRGH
jgi:copper(I)-binding protein